MSEFSTLRITRDAARKFLLGQIMEATDDEIGSLMDPFLAERLYNCQIVNNDAANDDETL